MARIILILFLFLSSVCVFGQKNKILKMIYEVTWEGDTVRTKTSSALVFHQEFIDLETYYPSPSRRRFFVIETYPQKNNGDMLFLVESRGNEIIYLVSLRAIDGVLWMDLEPRSGVGILSETYGFK